MQKNYYLILGITSDATLDDVKEAYRRLAKEFHPDHYGKNHSPFLAIHEAYSVLSDPIKRQTHDLTVLNQKKRAKPRYGQNIKSGSRMNVEPLIPGQEALMPLRTRRPERSFPSYRPLYDKLFDRTFSNFRPGTQPKSEQIENVHVVIKLTT